MCPGSIAAARLACVAANEQVLPVVVPAVCRREPHGEHLHLSHVHPVALHHLLRRHAAGCSILLGLQLLRQRQRGRLVRVTRRGQSRPRGRRVAPRAATSISPVLLGLELRRQLQRSLLCGLRLGW